MQCAACGAKMLLTGVVLANIATMPGFERHAFKCSSCPQTARRLAICRAKMAARTSAWAKAVEKLRARQGALTERAAYVQAPGEDSKQAQRGGAHAARRLNALNESEIPPSSRQRKRRPS